MLCYHEAYRRSFSETAPQDLRIVPGMARQNFMSASPALHVESDEGHRVYCMVHFYCTEIGEVPVP